MDPGLATAWLVLAAGETAVAAVRAAAPPLHQMHAATAAHPIELPDPTPWLSGGELVMTTGLEIGADADDQFAYLQGLVAAGCVALAFDTGTRFDRVPDGLRAAGDALGFPVLAVPASTPFIAITRAVIDELTADQVRSVRQAAASELQAGTMEPLNQNEQDAQARALTEYRSSREAMADTPEGQLGLAGLALTLRDWPSAETAFKEALRLDPEIENGWLMLARLRSALGDEQGAARYLEEGISNLPRSIDLLLDRANIDVRRGNNEQAIQWYHRLLGIDAENRDAGAELAYDIAADSGVAGMPRARRNHDVRWCKLFDIRNPRGIVADHADGQPLRSQLVDQVECEGVVVVDHENHAGCS